jgi:hypothetical protein
MGLAIVEKQKIVSKLEEDIINSNANKNNIL